MPLEIPPQDHQAITTIKALSPSSLDHFIGALKNAPPMADPHEMAQHIGKKVPSLPVGQLGSVLSTLYTLYYIRDLSGVSPSVFLNDLIEGIASNPRLRTVAKDIPKLRSVFDKLLNIPALNTVSKAARLQRDGERLYCTSKILSDIRPVFGPDPAVRPMGAVLAHTLKIGYHEGKEHREFHVVLDSSDLETLADAIARAQSKDQTLRDWLKETKLPDLGD
jgi:hypothetical protein